MTHVCFVNMPFEYYSATHGGAVSTIIEATGRALLGMGHEVTVISWTHGHEHTTGDVLSLGDFRGRTRRLRGAWSRLLRTGTYQRLVLRRLKSVRPAPDILVLFNDYRSSAWLRPHVPTGTRIINWLQNDEPVPTGTWDASSPDSVIACSSYIRRRAVERGVPGRLAFTAMSGVDTRVFHPRPGWLDPPDLLRLLCIGRLDPNKGHDAALAAARLADVPLSVDLAGATWWYGDEVDGYAAELLASLADLGGNYLGLVARPDVPALFREHDVCLVLSRSEEPLGLVALEAMASGLAVIASPRGGLPEACGGAAVLIEPDDVRAVARALNGLSASDELAAAKAAARKRAERQPWEATARALLAAAG